MQQSVKREGMEGNTRVCGVQRGITIAAVGCTKTKCKLRSIGFTQSRLTFAILHLAECTAQHLKEHNLSFPMPYSTAESAHCYLL